MYVCIYIFTHIFIFIYVKDSNMLSFLRAQVKTNFQRSVSSVTLILKQKFLFCFYP